MWLPYYYWQCAPLQGTIIIWHSSVIIHAVHGISNLDNGALLHKRMMASVMPT